MESNNTQLYPIRQLALFKDKLKIEGSSSDVTEKKMKIEGIDKQLSDLDILVANQ